MLVFQEILKQGQVNIILLYVNTTKSEINFVLSVQLQYI